MVFAPRDAAQVIGWKARDDDQQKQESPQRAKRKRVTKVRTSASEPPMSLTTNDTQQLLRQITEPLEINTDMLPSNPPFVNSEQQESDAMTSGHSIIVRSITEGLCITGRAYISTLEGAIDILGYRIQASANTRFAIESPTWMSRLCLQPCSDSSSSHQPPTVLIESIQTNRSSSVSPTFQIHSIAESKHVTNISNKWIQSADKIIADVSPSTTPSPPEEKNPSTLEQSRILICGAKSVGKSTYVRYLIHRLLSSHCCSQVALIDCDPGQPEFSPPGMLTLTILSQPIFSPPHAHLICNTNPSTFTCASQHSSAYFFGHSSSKADPVSFCSIVQQLIRDFEKNHVVENNTPLVINTDGWIKGLGYEILSSIIQASNPKHVIQILGTTGTKFFDLTPHACTGRSISVIEAYGVDTFQSAVTVKEGDEDSFNDEQDEGTRGEDKFVPSQHLRSLRLCTYFLGGYDAFKSTGSEFKSSGICDPEFQIAKTLAGMKPYVISMDALNYASCLNVSLHENEDDNLFDTLNGSIVGLCSGGDSMLPCYGLGLVRSVDRVKRLLYILTPQSLSILQTKVNTIVHGKIPIPVECLYRGGDSESFAYQSSSSK